jgi:cell division protease FtsH
MVCEFGMSERLGPRVFGEVQGQVFLGRELGHERDYSDSTATLIDEEVKVLIDVAYESAISIVTTHRDQLEAIAAALIERETLDSQEIDMIMQGKHLPDIFAKEAASEQSLGDSDTSKKEQPARPKRRPRDVSLEKAKELLT